MPQGHSTVIRLQLLAVSPAGVIYGLVERRIGRRENHDRMLTRGYLPDAVLTDSPEDTAAVLRRVADQLISGG